jgi:putative Mn2+ efflux pump MntP
MFLILLLGLVLGLLRLLLLRLLLLAVAVVVDAAGIGITKGKVLVRSMLSFFLLRATSRIVTEIRGLVPTAVVATV